ncbi:MAG: DUF1634 domain-containing protein [Terriglobales bacterium]|jgi:uncharacterized membrane protein
MKTLPDWTDQRFEELIANLLRTGVLLSATVVLLGAILYLARHGFSPADYRVFRGEPRELKSVQGIIGYALQRHGRGLIQLGLLLLIATPVARVTFSVFGFARERDWMYVGFTLIVLVVLLYSLFGSFLIA